MITLQLRDYAPNQPVEVEEPRQVSLSDVEQRFAGALADLHTLLDQQRQATVVIPSDFLYHAVATLFPPERMTVIAGRRRLGRSELGVSYDVTGRGPQTHRAHVQADPERLRTALIGFELAGVELAGWMHSHPGTGPSATTPSDIDRAQYKDWTRDFGARLLGLIVVADGFVRVWGDAIDSGLLRVEIVGRGVQIVRGHRNVYRIDR